MGPLLQPGSGRGSGSGQRRKPPSSLGPELSLDEVQEILYGLVRCKLLQASFVLFLYYISGWVNSMEKNSQWVGVFI